MSRRCTVCDHPNRNEIDRLLLCPDSIRDIADKFGLSKTSLQRHKARHLPADLAKAHEAGEVSRADRLLFDLEQLRHRTDRLLAQAEEFGELKVYPAFLREMREQIKLLAELEGRIASQPTVTVQVANIYHSHEWLQVGRVLAKALEGYPEARRKAAEALLELARGAGR